LADRNVYARGNREWMDKARVEIREGDVLQLPFPAEVFDLVAAVEIHFWWPELPRAMREVLQVLKPGGTVVIIAEIQKERTPGWRNWRKNTQEVWEFIVSTGSRMDAISAQSKCLSYSDGVYSST
jgi:SAM-dependent methyltransferase